jgi:uncharacterized protein (TIGR02996 family)
MTTEDDFQAALDANPEDWQTRLVFADWLQERGDPRAEGYRALAVRRAVPQPPHGRPRRSGSQPGWAFWISSPGAASLLPEDWWFMWKAAVQTARTVNQKAIPYCLPTRRAAEDAAALAFAELPAERRTALLAERPKGKDK